MIGISWSFENDVVNWQIIRVVVNYSTVISCGS